MGNGYLSQESSGRDMALKTHPPLSPRVTIDTATNLPPSCAASIFTYQWPAYDKNNYYHSAGFVIKTECNIVNPINLTYCAYILYGNLSFIYLFFLSVCINPISSNTKGSHYH